MKTFRFAILLMFLAVTSTPVWATEVEETVVTGTRSSKSLELSPVKVEVVNQQTINKTHAKNLKEALLDVPGLTFNDIRGRQGAELWIQGLDAKRIKILLDSEPVTGAKDGGFDLEQIGVANIEQIEIVKGATSALYGSDAIGGVVNIITQVPEQALKYKIRADIGSHGNQNPGGKASQHSRRHLSTAISTANELGYLAATANINQDEGFKLVNSGNVYQLWSQQGAQGDREDLSVKAGWYVNDNLDIYLGATHYEQDLFYRYYLVDLPFIKTELVTRFRKRFGFNYYVNENVDFSVRYYNEKYDENALQDSQHTEQIALQRDGKIYREHYIATQWNFRANANLAINTGLEHYQDFASLFVTRWDPSANNNNGQYVSATEIFDYGVNGELDKPLPSVEIDGTEFFAQLDYQLGNVEILPGVRWQEDSRFGEKVTFKVNARLDLQRFEACQSDFCLRQFIRFGAGQGYRAPNVTELFYRFDNPELGYKVFGNPALQPEESDSLQLSWNMTIRNEQANNGAFSLDETKFELGLFYNDVTDLIESTLVSFGSLAEEKDSEYQNQNFGEVRIQGAELSSNTTLKNGLAFNFAYTYLDAHNQIDDAVLPRRPKHQIKSSLLYEPAEKNFDMGIYWRLQTKEYLDRKNLRVSPEWQTIDLKFNYALNKTCSVFTGANNIFDEQRQFGGEDFRPKEARYIYIGFKIEN